MTFVLDPRLADDTLPLGRLTLSRLLLMNDCQYPWLILVPEQPGLSELFDLAEGDRQRLMQEIATVAAALADVCRPSKINVGALGNIVRQLHVHVVARSDSDPAWPGPVWGKLPPSPYSEDAAAHWRQRLTVAMAARESLFWPHR